MPRILVVEDDRELAAMLGTLLADEGYDVETAGDGHTGLHYGLTRKYDVMLFDRGLPAIEGLDLMTRLRSKDVTTPVLILSARGNPADRVEGIDAGAEDYLGKPFDVDELLARLRGLLRRSGGGLPRLTLPGGVFDPNHREVIRADGSVVPLTKTEALFLTTLARSPSRVFRRSELLDHVFARAEHPNAVETYVHYLREKLGSGSVETVRGVGYRMGRV